MYAVQDCQKEAGSYYQKHKSEPKVIQSKIAELELQIQCNERMNSGPLFKALSKIPKNNSHFKRKRDSIDNENSNSSEDKSQEVSIADDREINAEPGPSSSSTSIFTSKVVQLTSGKDTDENQFSDHETTENLVCHN